MALPLPSIKIRPLPERERFRIAVVISVAVHFVLLLCIGRSAARLPDVKPSSEPIEVSLAEPPTQPAAPQFLSEPQVEPKLQPKPAPPPPPKRVVKMEARPVRRFARSRMHGGGSPDAPRVKNPSPITSRRPSAEPASNAGGKAKAAPAAPHLLTSKRGRTASGPIGKGSAPSGPGGRAEVPGGGPTYGPGVMGGPTPVYPKEALDQDWEGTVALSVKVGADGKIGAVTVTRSSGHDALDQAALRAVRRGWTFKPGMAKGKPAAGKVTVLFSFSKGEVSKG